MALLSEAKDRERRLIECRKTAEERKNYFESMERHMFATRSSVKVSSLYCNTGRGPRHYLDTSAFDIFGKFVPMRNFKKWY